jgi:hypothetical protein
MGVYQASLREGHKDTTSRIHSEHWNTQEGGESSPIFVRVLGVIFFPILTQRSLPSGIITAFTAPWWMSHATSFSTALSAK